MASDWRDYQEEAAEFFRSLGLTAESDVTLQGVRTTHDVDVYVRIDVAGVEVTWIVECKHWQTPVTKLHVMGLRAIVADLGADRGIILCETGYQRGAIAAANLTNVQVTSLAALSSASRETIHAVRLRELFDRVESCRTRYWNMPKEIRIKNGLRPGLFSKDQYSGQFVVDVANDVLGKAFRGTFPIDIDDFDQLKVHGIPARLHTHEEVTAALEPLIGALEAKLDSVDALPPEDVS